MKNFFLLLLSISPIIASGRISTQNPTGGSITITPKGVQGSTNSGTVTTNVSVGPNALQSNTSGNWNTAIGRVALSNNTTGDQNSALGNGTLTQNLTGRANTAVGEEALLSNTSGWSNTVLIGELYIQIQLRLIILKTSEKFYLIDYQ